MTMSTNDMILLGGIILANVGAVLTVFLDLNIKIAGTAKDILAIRADMDEHKNKNKDDIKELKDIIFRDKTENRDDHRSILTELNLVTKTLSDFKMDIIKAITKNVK